MQGLLENTQHSKVHSCVFMLTSTEKNSAFLFLVLFPPHLKPLLTYTWHSVQNTPVLLLWRWKSQREGEEAQKDVVQACYNVLRHKYQYLIFYKTIYKMISMLNTMIYFMYKVK